MKNIEARLIPLLENGFCTPRLSTLAKKLGEPVTTIQYNIKMMEKEGKIKAYKAVYDHSKIGKGFVAYALLELDPEAYVMPEAIAKRLAKNPFVESVDIVTGDWELVVKLRAGDQHEYYELVKNLLSMKNVAKIKSLISLRQMKSEHVEF